MDSNELLEQEEAFHKLNAEIELRTRQLMKNVEAVMNKHCDSKNWPPEYSEVKQENGRKQDQNDVDVRAGYDPYDTNLLSDYGTNRPRRSPVTGSRKARVMSAATKEILSRKETTDSGFVPPCAKGMSAESLSRFLKAKGKLLQEELDQVKRELQMKTDECKKVQLELRTRDEEKFKIVSEITNFKEKVKKLESGTASLTEKLQMRDSENALLKKEVEMLKQDIKKLSMNTSGNETKLNRVKEENEKLKLQLKQAELNEKEARDKYRMKNEEMVNAVRKLEKQKSDLITAIKKQVILIENLKKQKGLLEIEGCVNFTEKEFIKLLEGKFEERR